MINARSHKNLVSIVDRKEIPVLGAMERVNALHHCFTEQLLSD